MATGIAAHAVESAIEVIDVHAVEADPCRFGALEVAGAQRLHELREGVVAPHPAREAAEVCQCLGSGTVGPQAADVAVGALHLSAVGFQHDRAGARIFDQLLGDPRALDIEFVGAVGRFPEQDEARLPRRRHRRVERRGSRGAGRHGCQDEGGDQSRGGAAGAPAAGAGIGGQPPEPALPVLAPPVEPPPVPMLPTPDAGLPPGMVPLGCSPLERPLPPPAGFSGGGAGVSAAFALSLSWTIECLRSGMPVSAAGRRKFRRPAGRRGGIR
jgi:hypothetical protein